MRILFMGTPDIAAESLAALLDAGHEVCGVFTRRDKPVGRKQILTAPPVKQLAVEHGLSVYQPRTLRDGSSDELIKELAPDIIVVVAYGCIIPPQLLHAAKYGCINLHVSLLPKYRGSAPIQWAVLNGDEGTEMCIRDRLYAGYGKNIVTALATINGSAVGILATEKAALCHKCTAKAARFVRLCDAYSIPVVTVVNTEGFGKSEGDDQAGGIRQAARMAGVYAEARCV